MGVEFGRGQEDIWLSIAIEPDREADHRPLMRTVSCDASSVRRGLMLIA